MMGQHTPESADRNLEGNLHELRQPQRLGELLVGRVALKVRGAHGDALYSIRAQKEFTTKKIH